MNFSQGAVTSACRGADRQCFRNVFVTVYSSDLFDKVLFNCDVRAI